MRSGLFSNIGAVSKADPAAARTIPTAPKTSLTGRLGTAVNKARSPAQDGDAKPVVKKDCRPERLAQQAATNEESYTEAPSDASAIDADRKESVFFCIGT